MCFQKEEEAACALGRKYEESQTPKIIKEEEEEEEETAGMSSDAQGTEAPPEPATARRKDVTLGSACRIVVYPVSANKLFPVPAVGKTTFQIAAGPVDAVDTIHQETGTSDGAPKVVMVPQLAPEAAGALPLPLASPGPSSEFTHQCILQLIEAVGKRWDMYSARERTRLFHNVQQELEALGHTFTMERIRRKWNNLVVTYKRVKDRSRETGQAKTTWEYYEMMDALLSNTIGAQPVATAAATMVTTLTPDAPKPCLFPAGVTAYAQIPNLIPTAAAPALTPQSTPAAPAHASSSSSSSAAAAAAQDPPAEPPPPPAAPPRPAHRLASRLRIRRKLRRPPAADTAASFLAQQQSQAETRTSLLRGFLAAQEERGRAEEERQRRQEARQRRRERREATALEAVSRMAAALELVSSKQDTIIALLQRLADRQ
ncbi:uncharacterized protein [Lepisosteus oculatus]|uniref:uncharacterized protein isoform X2 n=1 Tax=Lepisosteus oculatus TaxID=7918 RepID=UPI0035F525CA